MYAASEGCVDRGVTDNQGMARNGIEIACEETAFEVKGHEMVQVVSVGRCHLGYEDAWLATHDTALETAKPGREFRGRRNTAGKGDSWDE